MQDVRPYAIIVDMNVDLSRYSHKKICVAVSGGKDSMALLHYIFVNREKFGITLTALNCDHGMRGEASSRDSRFVLGWCEERGLEISFFKAEGFKSEAQARAWRYGCYSKASARFGGAAIATAHHLNDNAETVLFNLARGSALAGVTGISDGRLDVGDETVEVIRPLIECSRAEIDEYIAANGVPYVTDETNLTDDYTRNYIRHNVLPRLEEAVPGAAKAIYRFSRLATEDEEYLARLARGYVSRQNGYCTIKFCEERPVFGRAAVAVIKGEYAKKDYTQSHLDALYGLQFLSNGKIFKFLGLTAYKENGEIVLCRDAEPVGALAFDYYGSITFGGFDITIERVREIPASAGVLRFDCDKIPPTAVIRTRRAGDKFTKFGGGTKSLGDYFTDKKVAVRLRDSIPLIADGDEVLAVCGYEISDKIKTDKNTVQTAIIGCRAANQRPVVG